MYAYNLELTNTWKGLRTIFGRSRTFGDWI